MEIRNTRADDTNAAPVRIDLTRQSRESIRTRQPIPPEPEVPGESDDAETGAQQVKEARDAYREQRQRRLANVRANHTANHPRDYAAEVTAAREAYRTRMEEIYAQRQENTHPPAAPALSSDRVDLSSASKQLAKLDSVEADELRSSRVAQLKAMYAQNLLPDEDLIARAAYRLLDRE